MRKFIRILSALLVLVICISAVACGGKGDDTSMNNDNPIDNRTKVGDKIILGRFDQDGNRETAEDISWTVIKVEEGRALLLADKCLSYSSFHNTAEAFSWADCSLHDWLNYDFYKTAFNDEEKELLEKVTIGNTQNYIFSVGTSEKSEDRVFLLSMDEAKELLTDATVNGEPTEAVKKTATLTHGNSSCNWWLRTQGSSDMKAAVVGYNGVVNFAGLRGDLAQAGIRPSVWYKVETNAKVVPSPIAYENISTAQVGDKVTMGKYDNDANNENGAEAIVWTVAAIENGKYLLVSDYALDAFTYHAEINNEANWSNATLKIWLNSAFMNKAFDDAEKAKIATSTLATKNTNGGADILTYNQMFVLSAEELVKYFPEREDRMIKPTETALENGVYADPIYGTCDYWVREAGTTAGNGAYTYYYGDVNEAGALARSTFIGVRPAMWVLP